MEIKVRDIRKVKLEKGNLRGIADIEMGGLIIRGLRILNGKKGLWVAWPSKKWTGPDGSPHYVNLVEPSSAEVRNAVSEAVLRAWRAEGQSPSE